MIDFYALTSPNVQKIFIMLEECEPSLQASIPVDVWKGEQYDPDVPQDQPERQDPGDRRSARGRAASRITVFESGAILMYLADKTGRFLPDRHRAEATKCCSG